MTAFVLAELAKAVKFPETNPIRQRDKPVLQFRKFLGMFEIITQFTLANVFGEKAWKNFFALDEIFPLLL